MRKTIIAVLAVLLFSLPAWAQQKEVPVPSLAGLYNQSSSGYVKMELATSSGFKTSGGAKAAFSYGIAKVKGKWIYNGSNAVAQLASHPVFVLVSQVDVSTQSIALVRFDIKKEHREAEYCEAGAWTGVQEENKNTIPLTVTRLPNTNTLTITPKSDLPAVPSDSPNLLSRYRSTLSASMGLFLITARTPSVVLIAGTGRPHISMKNSSPRFRARACLTSCGTGLYMPSRRPLD
jgi:hypothetical protein